MVRQISPARSTGRSVGQRAPPSGDILPSITRRSTHDGIESDRRTDHDVAAIPRALAGPSRPDASRWIRRSGSGKWRSMTCSCTSGTTRSTIAVRATSISGRSASSRHRSGNVVESMRLPSMQSTAPRSARRASLGVLLLSALLAGRAFAQSDAGESPARPGAGCPAGPGSSSRRRPVTRSR